MVLTLLAVCPARAAEPDVEAAMVEAATFFRERLSVDGSYVWIYDASDLARRRGEGITNLSQGWSQPPGTPAVGLAFLAAFEATGRPLFLEATRETADALIRTQLESGGWQGLLEFEPAARQAWCYRVDIGSGRPDCAAIKGNKLKNATSIDDNITQSSLTFLIRFNAELQEDSGGAGDAALYGLERLLEAQYPNGAWPGRFDFKMPNALTTSAWRARYPADWSRDYVKPGGELYLVNDHVVRDVIRLLLLAADVYGEPAYLATARRAGEFLLSARMPEPQPGWAQLYNADLEPIWGRRFEPPAITSSETAGSIEALLDLHAATGETRYLEGAAPAVRWLGRSRLPAGDWSRFYALGSNRPLYVDTDYRVTYDDDVLPDHYRFKSTFDIPAVLERYRRQTTGGEAPSGWNGSAPVIGEAEVGAIVGALDDQGRWVEDDRIHAGRFAENLTALAAFVAARNDDPLPDYLWPIRHQLDR